MKCERVGHDPLPGGKLLLDHVAVECSALDELKNSREPVISSQTEIGTIGVTINWLCVRPRLAPRGRTPVFEEHAVDESGILLEVHQAIAIDPEDLANVLFGEFGDTDVMPWAPR